MKVPAGSVSKTALRMPIGVNRAVRGKSVQESTGRKARIVPITSILAPLE